MAIEEFESWYNSTLSAKLDAADTTMEVATAPTVTRGRLYLKSWSTEEWIQFTWVSGTTLTWLTRWLSQTADWVSGWTGSTWKAWQTVTLVEMHDQKFNRQRPAPLVFATTSARDTALWADWAATQAWFWIYITADGEHYKYNLATNQWETIDTWTITPNASTTTAGKVEIATSAETKAWTDTWWTWASLIALPSDIAANEQSWTFVYAPDAEASDTYVISLTPNLTTYTTGQAIRFSPNTTNTWACTLNVDGLWAKSIKLIDWTDPLDWDLTSGRIYTVIDDWTNFVLQMVPERAADAEAEAWTNTTNFVTPNQLPIPKIAILQTTRAYNAASWTVNLAHWLWVTPKYVIVSWYANTAWWAWSEKAISFSWFSDGTVNKCSSHWMIDWWSSIAYIASNDSSNCIDFRSWSSSASARQQATIELDGTNVDIVWTYNSQSWTDTTMYITILVIA